MFTESPSEDLESMSSSLPFIRTVVRSIFSSGCGYSFDAPMMFLARIRQGIIQRREGARRRQRQIPFDGWLLCCEPLFVRIEGNGSLLELACLTRRRCS